MPRHKPIRFEGTLEPSVKSLVTRLVKDEGRAKTVINATLAIVALGGVLALGVIAPNLFSVVTHKLARNNKKRKEDYRQIWRRFYELRKKDLLEFDGEDEDGTLIYKVSDKGKKRIRRFVYEELVINKPKKWDGKWRLVIFDIPEKYRKVRSSFSLKLKKMGFYQCQKSVWIHPFQCNEEVNFLTDYLNIQPFVKVFKVEEMTDGKTLYYFRNFLKKIV